MSLRADYPVLCYYDVNLPVTIQCDSGETGSGAALPQHGQPVAFASRTLTSTERGYVQIEKECLAIVFACERFNQYLFRRESVSVQSDHKPVEAIFAKPLTAAPKRLKCPPPPPSSIVPDQNTKKSVALIWKVSTRLNS